MSTSQETNALIYSSIQNNLTTEDLLTGSLISKFDIPNYSETNSYLNSLLSETVIKRACSMGKGRMGVSQEEFPVLVRIPIPDNYDFSGNPLAETWQKFGYVDKLVYVPATLCNTLNQPYGYYTNPGMQFMTLYCNNVKKFYKNELAEMGAQYNVDEFAQYKPECACFGDQPSYISGSIPPTCYLPGCDPGNANVYLDFNSRNGCKTNICVSNLDLSNAKIEGSAVINSKVEQQCGTNSITTGSTPTTTSESTGFHISLLDKIVSWLPFRLQLIFGKQNYYIGFIILLVIIILMIVVILLAKQ